MLPEAQDVHVDAALSNISISFRNQMYIYDQLFPYVDVPKQSDYFYVFDRADLLRDEAAIRAPGTLARRGGYRVSTSQFFCDNYAFGKELPDEVKANADAALQIEQADTEYCTDKMLLKMERQIASEVFTTSVWATDSSPSVKWDTYATSDPIGDIRDACTAALKATGHKPNTLTIGYDVWTTLQDHPDLVDRLPDNALRQVQLNALAELLELEKVLVGSAVYNSAAEGDAHSGAFVWGDNALLTHTPKAPGIRTPAAGYSFRWVANGLQRQVLQYRDAPAGKKQDITEVHEYVDFKVTSTALGYMLNNVLST